MGKPLINELEIAWGEKDPILSKFIIPINKNQNSFNINNEDLKLKIKQKVDEFIEKIKVNKIK